MIVALVVLDVGKVGVTWHQVLVGRVDLLAPIMNLGVDVRNGGLDSLCRSGCVHLGLDWHDRVVVFSVWGLLNSHIH